MVRAKRKVKVKKSKQLASKDESDDERLGDEPDVDSEEFFYDDVDKYHKNREKILLEKSGIHSDEESDGDEQVEEVLGLDLDSDDDDEGNEYYYKDEDDDLEEEEDAETSDESDTEKGIPSEKAWGGKKKIYYDADDQKEKDVDSEEEEILDKEEEEEALAMQERMAARMDEGDFDIEDFELAGAESSEKQDKENDKAKQEKIIKDLSKLSEEEKLKLLAKDSPELFELVEDFREKLTDVINCLQPLVQMARSGAITNKQGIDYLETKHQLTMNYLVNISFYLLLKANQMSVKNHPVIERLVQYRELLGKLKPLDQKLQGDMEHFLKIHNTEKEENKAKLVSDQKTNTEKLHSSRKNKPTKKVKFSKEILNPELKKTSQNVLSTKKRKSPESVDPLLYYEAIKEMKKRKKEEQQNAQLLRQKTTDENVIDTEGDGKRSITYQISKNKGLTPKRKKELRNPRIKHRKKFSKAKVKHKSQVLPVVKEISRYGGETTGIKTHLTRGIRIK